MSRTSRHFSAVRTEGGLLPQDLLARIQGGDPNLVGTKAETYHLGPHERIGEAANRSWSRLAATWRAFQEAVEKEPESSLATGLTRDRWLLPLFQELGYGRLPRGSGIEVEGKTFAVSHTWHHSAIHLLGCRIDLDRRQKGVVGAAKSSPHGLVQEFLNRSDEHLWGFVTNGYRLRVLRDHHSLTRQAYVEFDLQTIMDGEQYSEFLLLWLVCHQSRVEADKPEECWLETWVNTSREEGVRALDKLRDGVEKAIESFGTGFLAHRDNTELKDALESGELDKQEFYRQILRLVYRRIFLFVAEERDALLDPNATEEAREHYRRYYATRRLRDLADKRRGSPHPDLWRGLALVMEKLDDGYPALGLPALGSLLWSQAACPRLMEATCANEHVLSAIRHLSHIQEGKTRYPVNWRNVGADELGSIYESLLERHPRIHKEAATFKLETAAGHERKTTGSYYTPTPLVDCLLDSALDPVLDEASKKPEPEAAVLDLKVCDPACGSGHFLVAAARRIAKRLASVRSGDDDPSPHDVQAALRDVVGRCIYGVDLNPMAVELCKVSLWMEATEPGKPLLSSTATSSAATRSWAPPRRCCQEASPTTPSRPSRATTRTWQGGSRSAIGTSARARPPCWVCSAPSRGRTSTPSLPKRRTWIRQGTTASPPCARRSGAGTGSHARRSSRTRGFALTSGARHSSGSSSPVILRAERSHKTFGGEFRATSHPPTRPLGKPFTTSLDSIATCTGTWLFRRYSALSRRTSLTTISRAGQVASTSCLAIHRGTR